MKIDQSGLQGKTRDRPISRELEVVLLKAGSAAGIDVIYVTSGGQPGTTGRSTGSTRHNGGRAADLKLFVRKRALQFSDADADDAVKNFVIAAAANGATGIGAGVHYMGAETLHVGFGLNPSDKSKLVWGAAGRSVNAPPWLRTAANQGWNDPPEWAFAPNAELTEDLPEELDNLLEEEEDDVQIPKRFNAEVIRAAQATQRVWGTPASITLAQWAIESAYGERMPAGSNNPFGIKARKGEPSVVSWTNEYYHGKKVKVQQPFRVFSNLEEAFLKHGELLGEGAPYANARRYKNDPDRFADALTGIYATDPQYGTLLKKIMRTNNLYAFDDAATFRRAGDDDYREADVSILKQGDTGSDVKAVQERLTELGYKLGSIDGKFGPLTSEALLAFQSQNALSTTGIVDSATRAMLREGPRRRLDENRLRTEEEDLAKGGSRIINGARKSRLLSWIAGVFGAVGVGNSALTTAASSTVPAAVPLNTAGLEPFLTQVQSLPTSPTPAQMTSIVESARALASQLGSTGTSPEVRQLIARLREAASSETLQNPQIASALNALTDGTTIPVAANRTIFDLLPGLFPNGTILHDLMQALASLGASLIPGLGGSTAILLLGLFGRYYANKIAEARVNDQRTGGNVNPVRTPDPIYD